MKPDIRSCGRVMRIVAILTAGIIYRSWWGLIGLLPLVTGAVGFCGLYSLFGTGTGRRNATSV